MHALEEDEEMKRECEEMVQGMYTIIRQAGKRNKIPRNETAKNERREREKNRQASNKSGEVGGNILDF